VSDTRPIVIPFSDDSTLIFARRMRQVLRKADPECGVEMTWYTEENALSYRQMCTLLPEGPERVVDKKGLRNLLHNPAVRALITSRVYQPISTELKKPDYRNTSARPCIISFLGGLDFFPQDGFMRRRNCDGVFLFPKPAMQEYDALKTRLDEPTKNCWQQVDFGHPAVIAPPALPSAELETRRDIYFFPQAISPLTKRARLHVLQAIVALARAHPDRAVYIKLRHLPSENTKHLHREQFPYSDLLEDIGFVPDNLHVTDADMETVLKTAAIGITCTSTAALDVVRAGVPCMIYLDYVDHYRDRLVEPMRRLFAHSNLIVSLEELLHLRLKEPDPDWLEGMFSPPDLGTRVFKMVESFQSRSAL
jgi:hypothetical protein